MQRGRYENRDAFYQVLLSVAETGDCEAVADFAFDNYVNMPKDEEDRLGITKEDRDLSLTLMAMDAGEEFWYSKEELKEIILAAWKKTGQAVTEVVTDELEMLRSRICHGEQELISTLTPEQFFALLSHDYDTGFAAGKASAQKEILCMLAADGMPVEKIALLLRIKTETVLEVMATKQAHIEKCDYRVKSTYPKICESITAQASLEKS